MYCGWGSGFIHGNSSRALLHPPANNSWYAYAYRHCTGTKLFICTPPPPSRDFGPRVQLHYFFCYTCSTPYSDSLKIAQMLSSTTSSILLSPLDLIMGVKTLCNQKIRLCRIADRDREGEMGVRGVGGRTF